LEDVRLDKDNEFTEFDDDFVAKMRNKAKIDLEMKQRLVLKWMNICRLHEHVEQERAERRDLEHVINQENNEEAMGVSDTEIDES
jgi:hypothetical protein